MFFVHNRVETIHAMKEYLEKIMPGIRVVVGHGQIEERELEKRMLAFIDRQYDVLLSTTIIENGIDIPACNTILINHAERFGLSQLYQLRGRVGRSDRLAFCYLVVPSDLALSSDARKRLAAIRSSQTLAPDSESQRRTSRSAAPVTSLVANSPVTLRRSGSRCT